MKTDVDIYNGHRCPAEPVQIVLDVARHVEDCSSRRAGIPPHEGFHFVCPLRWEVAARLWGEFPGTGGDPI